MKEFENEFYAALGSLSVKFAHMEYKLSVILNYLIGSDEDIVSITLTENNSLHQNIELLKKINRVREFHSIHLNELLGQIKQIKSDRNRFIHGLWGTPFKSENDIKVTCEERKLKYKEIDYPEGKSKEWAYNNFKTYSLSYLKKLMQRIDKITFAQDKMIKKLESDSLL